MARHPDIPCAVYRLAVTPGQREAIEARVGSMLLQRELYHYSILGTALCRLDIAHERGYHFFCSQFVGDVLARSGAVELPKAPSLMRPEDFTRLPGAELIYKGPLSGAPCVGRYFPQGERTMPSHDRPELSEKAKKIIAAASIAVFVLLTAAIAWFVGRPMLKFVSEPEHFRAWVDSGGLMSRVWFLGMQLLQVFVAIIPGEPMEIGAGYAFGAVEGTLLCLAGTTIGSMAVYFFVRRFGVRAVEIFFSKEKIESLRFLRDTRRRNTLVFLLMLIPGTPKDLLSYFVPLTGMGPWTWFWITTVARIPSIVTSTIGGSALGVQNYVFAGVALGVTLLISGVGLLIYRRICLVHQEHLEHKQHHKTEEGPKNGR